MSQTAITFAFEQWKAKEAIGGTRVVLDEFVFANVPGLDPNKPIDRKEGMPAAGHIVHRQAVNKTGVVNSNTVVYSVTLGTEIGDFDFNWIGLVNKASGTVAMVIHAPTQRKVANRAGQQGNAITRSFLMEYDGAAKETGITTPAETWQIDFTARLGGIDDMQRLINRDHYGAGAFFGNGFLVVKNGAQYVVNAGTGYVGGLRAVLATNQTITVGANPVKVWVDASYQGNVVSQWSAVVKLTVAATAADYTDAAGFRHYVFAVASIDTAGNITDLRPKGSLSDQTGNEAFLRKDKNLSDLNNPAEARGSLGLGTAATRNVGTGSGNLMAVGAYGLGGTGILIADANTSDKNGFYSLRAGAHTNSPNVNASWEMLCIKYDAGSTKQLFWQAGAATTRTYVRYRTSPGGQWGPFQYYYSTENKPTAADVGALTDTQAAQKYALRSYKVNGKPLTGDVNLLAGDVNAWNKTEADTRFVKRAGDTMSGALALPRVVFPDTPTAHADKDMDRANGFTVESINGDNKAGYPLPTGLGVVFTGKLNEYRNVQFAVGSGDRAFYLRSMRKDNAGSTQWARVYTTDYKPAAADVGAYSQGEADDKFLAKAGGKVSGEIQSTAQNNYRLITGDYGAFWRNDGNNMYLLFTNAKDQYGNWNNLRPFYANFKTGDVTFGHHAAISGDVKIGRSINISGEDFIRKSGTTRYSDSGGESRQTNGLRIQGAGDLYADLYHHEQVGKYHELIIHVANGGGDGWFNFRPDGSLQLNGPAVGLGVGAAKMASDGNIFGSRWGNKWLWDAIIEQVNGRVDWNTFNNRTHEGNGWWKDECTGILLQYGRTVTYGINENANLWQGFNIPFQQWVGPILLTPYWPGRDAWDRAYDYGVQLGSNNNSGFNWNKQAYSEDIRRDWDCGMTWFAIGK
ncbi:hypothetical protein GCM10023078_22020 [Gibbsiella greigii]